MRLLRKLMFVILSLPKTLYFNIRTFGIKGIGLPILVSWRTKITCTCRNAIEIYGPKKTFMMTFGFGGSDGVISNKYSELCLEPGSKMIIKGKVQFAEGCSIRNNGIIEIGDKSGMNKNSFISCYHKITIGSYFTAGWNVNIRDSDGHSMIKSGEIKPLYSSVYIGDKVWVGACSDILKGVSICSNSVVAYRSLVVKPFKEEHILIGGAPAKVIQNNIDWKD